MDLHGNHLSGVDTPVSWVDATAKCHRMNGGLALEQVRDPPLLVDLSAALAPTWQRGALISHAVDSGRRVRFAPEMPLNRQLRSREVWGITPGEPHAH